MKANEFLKSLSGNLNITLPDEVLAKFDTDLPEGFETKFTESYLTRDRAKSDTEIISDITKKQNKKIFDDIDSEVKDLLEYVTDDEKKKITSTFSTLEKLKLLKVGFDNAMKTNKGKNATEEVNKVLSEKAAEIESLKRTFTAEKDAIRKQMEEQQFDFYISQKLANYNLASSFADKRAHFNQLAALELKSKGYQYVFENGAVAVRQEKNGVMADVYEGEKKITVEAILDKFIDPFLAKSNPGAQQQSTSQQAAQLPPMTGSEDLRTLMMRKAQTA